MPWLPIPAAILVVAIQGSTPAVPNNPPPPSGGSEGPSVEDLIKEAKMRSEKARTMAGGRLTILLAELDVSHDKFPERVDATIQEILGLRDASTRPLIDSLKEPKDSTRGQNAARALARSTEANVIPELEATLAQNGPAEQRARIAWILGKRDPEKAIPLLRPLLADADSAVVGQAALALSQLKAKDTAPAIAEKLPRASAALAKNLLAALAALEDPKVLPSVLAFIETQQSAECTGAIAEVIRRWKSKELLAPSLKMVLRGSSATEEAADLVRAVDKAITAADRDAIAALKRILSESGMSFEVKEECAYALYTARDPFGKTWLLQPVNDAIRENPEGATLLRSRARIYLRLKLYREAQRDFEEVKKLASVNKKASIDGEEWIEVARANAGAKSYQPAADAIRNALGLGIRPKGFRDLPEFVDMRKQQKYAGLFDGD